MTRSVPEWIGKTDDADVPNRVKLRIWRRQCGDSNFAICPLSGAILRTTSECQLDHEKALIEGGEHRESNLRFVLTAAHREKTREEVGRKAHVDARAKSHAGIRKQVGPAAQIISAPMPTTPKAARRAANAADRLAVPGPRMPPNFVSAAGERS